PRAVFAQPVRVRVDRAREAFGPDDFVEPDDFADSADFAGPAPGAVPGAVPAPGWDPAAPDRQEQSSPGWRERPQ
nr:hypothetical protein [Clostridia bacterium]